jgi:hypothetical protein
MIEMKEKFIQSLDLTAEAPRSMKEEKKRVFQKAYALTLKKGADELLTISDSESEYMHCAVSTGYCIRCGRPVVL